MIMFKVICIEDLKPVRNPPPGYLVPTITDIVTVEKVVNYWGSEMYRLVEFPPVDGFTFIYDAHAFAPLNGPDEVAIAEARIEADAKELDAEFAKIVHEAETA